MRLPTYLGTCVRHLILIGIETDDIAPCVKLQVGYDDAQPRSGRESSPDFVENFLANGHVDMFQTMLAECARQAV